VRGDSLSAMRIQPLEDSAMSLKPQEDFSVPDETRRLAFAAFPKGCACLRISDALGGVYTRPYQRTRGMPVEGK
jgi:hypothetical protein